MKLLIADITDEGLSVELDESAASFDASFKGSPFSLAKPVTGTLTVRRFDSLIDISGMITALIKSECSRCLKSFDIEVKVDISSRLIEESSEGNGEGDGAETQLRKGDMDIAYFTGEELDIREIVAEQILLELPYKPLCGEGCKGLCSICGSDLNIKVCGCEVSEVKDDLDQRFAKLKGFKVK